MDKRNSGEHGRESEYWRSMREVSGDGGIDDVKAREFMAGVTDAFDLSGMSPMSRKRFLALLSASAAFAATGCSDYRDRGEIVPYTRKPEEVTEGVANYYASTCTGCAQHCGILIKTREGRPIKIDGNPDHPVNRGKICATGQASILSLYDPSRLRKPAYAGKSGKSGELTWTQVDQEVRQALDEAARGSREIALIMNPIVSPSTRKMIDQFTGRYPTTRVYTFDLFNDGNRRKAWELCYGTGDYPSVAWDRAKIIVALESDFLGSEDSSVESIRRYANHRDVVNGNDVARLYCVEGAMTLTGTNADYRIRLRPDQQLDFVLSLVHELGVVRSVIELAPEARSLAGNHTLEAFVARNGITAATMKRLVEDLVAARGTSIIHAGETLPTEIHLVVNYLNAALGNNGMYDPEHMHRSEVRQSTMLEFEGLVSRMRAGSVAVVVHVKTNPVFHLPRSLDYRQALQKVPLSVSLTELDDETSQLCTYALPAHNALEEWGDFAPRTGVVSFRQPVISPLYASRQAEATVLHWARSEPAFRESMYHDFLVGFWEKEVFPGLHKRTGFTAFWNSALHDGVTSTESTSEPIPHFSTAALQTVSRSNPQNGFTLILRRNYFLGDGRFANNGWLQEIPHPVSRITWDNYAALSPGTAKSLGLDSGDLITVSAAHSAQRLPVFVQPGQADGLVAVELGYGRWHAGPIGTDVGTDANGFLTTEGFTGGRVVEGVTVVRADGKHALASTQEHHALDDISLKDLHLKRRIIQEGTLAEYVKDPEFLKRQQETPASISRGVEYHGVKWAMSIDLNRCVSCAACVSACNVENNITVVGKEQVEKGREMHWLRIDRYFAGTPDEPSASHQPMLCQHCDNAPCENVCPVAATNHSPDGLNQMVYNRCVGTRYCSNNCPYKTRRFNFLNYRDNLADGYYLQEPVNLVQNPEVTVRSRGVMEKCTFCIQRIAEARQHAIEQGRELNGNDVKTACQVACPAEAIVFGDMNDAKSEVTKYRQHPLGYHVLEEVNARPNVTYIARLKNVHPET